MGLSEFDIKMLESDENIMGLWNAYYKARGDEDHNVRMKAIVAIGRIGGYKAMEPLVKALSDKEVMVRREAAFALISNLEKEDIGKISKVQSHASTAFGYKLEDSTKALELFSELLNDEDYKSRATAAIALGWIGDKKAVEPLLNALIDKKFEVRRNAAKALGDLEDAKSVEPLIKLLGDEEYEVRAYAAGALGWIKDAKSVEPLIKLLGDKECLVRELAARALGRIKDAKSVEPLRELLGDKEYKVRANVARALGDLKDTESVEAFINLLDDKESWVRESAAYAISRMDNSNAKAAYPLIKALSHKDKNVRNEVSSALIPILKNNAEAIEKNDITSACRLILKDTAINNEDRCDALDILLGDFTPDDLSVIIHALFETEYYPGSPAFHSVLISVLTKIGKPCVPAMVEAFNNKDNENDIRVRAIKVLRRIDDPIAIETVKKAAYDENLNVQNVAISALKAIEAKKKIENDDQMVSQEDESTLKNKSTKKSLISFLKRIGKN